MAMGSGQYTLLIKIIHQLTKHLTMDNFIVFINNIIPPLDLSILKLFKNDSTFALITRSLID
nr:hypothetical protein [uncultured bacterium]